MIRIGDFVVALLLIAAPLLSQERVVVDAVREIDRLEKKAQSVEVGNKNLALRLLKKMKIVKLKLDSARQREDPTYLDARKRFDALSAELYAKMNEKPPQPGEDGAVDLAKLNDLNDEISASYSKLRALRVNDIASVSAAQSWRDLIAGYRQRLASFPSGNENVRKVMRNLDAMDSTLQAGLRQLETNAKAADVQARMDAITAKYRRKNMPPRLQEPLEAAFIKQWVSGIVQRMNIELPRDMAAIQELGKDPNVNKQRLSSALHWVGSNGKRVLQETLDGGYDLVNGWALSSDHFVDFILETNPDDPSHVANRLLREGGFEHNMAELQKGLKNVDNAVAFEEGLGKPASPDRLAQKAKIERALEHFRACTVKALASVRMPKSQSDSKELLEIATQVLKRPGSKVSGWKRMVASYDVNDREKTQGSISHGTTSSTMTVYSYVWKEFNTHTAEQVGDEWYLFVNKFRRYSKGDERTTLNKWILYDRFQTTRILEENIDK